MNNLTTEQKLSLSLEELIRLQKLEDPDFFKEDEEYEKQVKQLDLDLEQYFNNKGRSNNKLYEWDYWSVVEKKDDNLDTTIVNTKKQDSEDTEVDKEYDAKTEVLEKQNSESQINDTSLLIQNYKILIELMEEKLSTQAKQIKKLTKKKEKLSKKIKNYKNQIKQFKKEKRETDKLLLINRQKTEKLIRQLNNQNEYKSFCISKHRYHNNIPNSPIKLRIHKQPKHTNYFKPPLPTEPKPSLTKPKTKYKISNNILFKEPNLRRAINNIKKIRTYKL